MQTNNSKEKVRQLQNKLYLTAKKCDSRRFHALYDKVYRDDVLFEAWKRVKANKGSSGVDGIGIEDIEEMGIEKYLSEIKSELMDGKYKPSPVKRVMIPKPDGSERPLGIPTVKDRIVQMATKIAIEPVFEADFRDCSYGFRPKRSARQALEVVRKACNNKGYYVVDADIEKFFDNVNQDKLMKLAEQRISDRRILKLIRQWLVSGVLYGNVLTISELGTSQPFRPLEVIARVKAQLRRYKKYSPSIITEKVPSELSYNKLCLNVQTHECLLDGETVSLTPTEFSILQVLLESTGNVVSIEELFHAVWKDEYYSKNSSTITVHIRHLREKLKDTSDTPQYIKTIWGVGYKI